MSVKKSRPALRKQFYVAHDAILGMTQMSGLIPTHRAAASRATVILHYGAALRRCYVPLLSTSILGDVRHTLARFRNRGFTVKRAGCPIEEIIFLS